VNQLTCSNRAGSTRRQTGQFLFKFLTCYISSEIQVQLQMYLSARLDSGQNGGAEDAFCQVLAYKVNFKN